MANIVINAGLTKIKKEAASGVAVALRGSTSVGFMDLRRIKYKNKTKHIAGLKYDRAKKMFFLTSPKKADDVNIGVFISTYDTEIVEGKVLGKEEITNIYEITSVGEKLHRGGYDEILEDAKERKEIYPEVFPKKVSLKILITSGKKKTIVKNSKGFMFTCDFETGKWYVTRPGSKVAELYKMSEFDLEVASLFKEQLPFPALDRKIYDSDSIIDYGKFDLTKHINETV